MARNTTTILSLPHELLDKVFSHLAWDASESLVPNIEDSDIANISYTCRTLREAVSPTLFRNARLKLRWIDGAIAEPGLYRLRREAPHLTKLVRCVHIKTEFTPEAGSYKLKPFTIPLALDHWTADDSKNPEADSAHRGRIKGIAQELYGDKGTDESSAQASSGIDQLAKAIFGFSDPIGNSQHPRFLADGTSFPTEPPFVDRVVRYHDPDDHDLVPSDSPEDALRAARLASRRRRLRLDALITCMVSLPPQTHHIIFEAVPANTQDHLQHMFALQICAMALKIFAGNLSAFGVISRCLYAGRRGHQHINSLQTLDDYDTVLGTVVAGLRCITNLTLAATVGQSNRLSVHSLDSIRANCWQVEPLCSNITQLALRNLTENRGRLFDLIKTFTSLKDLTISGVTLGPESGHPGQPRHRNLVYGDPLWLLFLVSIRLHRLALRLRLDDLRQWHTPNTLPASATRWLEEEAVPVGAKVDFERETRLTEDFSSFMMMWEMDDSDRGASAREDEAIGKLIDDAFSSRWKTFANMR